MTFPANFMLVAAMNPCPCGYYGCLTRDCRCGPNNVAKYRQRISGPLLDRIDIHVEVPAVQYADIAGTQPGETSEAIRGRVQTARAIQGERYGKNKVTCNSRMMTRHLKSHCQLDEAGQALIKMAMTELNFSARAYDRILKVARTIADLDASESIHSNHISEAIQYRTLDRNMWT